MLCIDFTLETIYSCWSMKNEEFVELRKILTKFGLSQSWGARQIGCTSQYLSDIMSGRCEASDVLKKEAIALRVKLETSGLRAV